MAEQTPEDGTRWQVRRRFDGGYDLYRADDNRLVATFVEGRDLADRVAAYLNHDASAALAIAREGLQQIAKAWPTGTQVQARIARDTLRRIDEANGRMSKSTTTPIPPPPSEPDPSIDPAME